MYDIIQRRKSNNKISNEEIRELAFDYHSNNS